MLYARLSVLRAWSRLVFGAHVITIIITIITIIIIISRRIALRFVRDFDGGTRGSSRHVTLWLMHTHATTLSSFFLRGIQTD
jgi:hypothetical protein